MKSTPPHRFFLPTPPPVLIFLDPPLIYLCYMYSDNMKSTPLISPPPFRPLPTLTLSLPRPPKHKALLYRKWNLSFLLSGPGSRYYTTELDINQFYLIKDCQYVKDWSFIALDTASMDKSFDKLLRMRRLKDYRVRFFRKLRLKYVTIAPTCHFPSM